MWSVLKIYPVQFPGTYAQDIGRYFTLFLDQETSLQCHGELQVKEFYICLSYVGIGFKLIAFSISILAFHKIKLPIIDVEGNSKNRMTFHAKL